MRNKNTFFITILVLALIGGSLGLGFLIAGGREEDSAEGLSAAVTMLGDRQIIDITAKGGYNPRNIQAKANLPTVLRVNTNNTYDCSASLVIPKLGYRKFLESTGVEEIVLNEDQAQGTLQGLCSMGMYSFKVEFN